jgi:trimeric autotransporter adhesin
MRFQRTSLGGRELPISLRASVCLVASVCLALCGGLRQAWASPATTTVLAIASSGSVVTTVTTGSVITLTATVNAGSGVVTPGQVNFCDATAASCTDIHLLGTAQLTSAGTATLRFRPGPGNHSYKAVFLGTLNDAASASAAIELTVGPRPPGLQTTYTTASISGPVATNTYSSTYALTASVGTKGTIPPSGTVSFSGTTMASNGTYTAYSLPGTATLGPASGGTGFLNVAIPQQRGGADAAPVVAIGDFNGDGIPDIVNSPFGGIAILLGNGDGTFAAPLVPDVDSGDGINAICVGDFNGDGITDLLIEDEDTGKLTVLLGKGDGTFTVGQSMPCFRASLAVADFNGDGKIDVALSGVAQATILLGNGDGTFTAAPNPPPSTSFQLVAADFNGDGKIDLALASYNSTTSALTPITILLGNGDGTFTAAPSQPQFVASKLVAADFNGDGKIDLAAINVSDNAVAILLGNGDGTFTAVPTSPTGGSGAAVGDFNGDGKPDLAIAASLTIPSEGSKITISYGNGDGTFAAGPEVDSLLDSFQLQFAAADFTGNGSSDLAAFDGLFLGNLTITTATADNVLPAGYNFIQANYAGDASNAPSSSTNAPAVLVPLPPFSLASSPVTVASGATASGAFSVTSTSFSGTLNLSCSISGPQNQANPPTCSVPASTTPLFPNRTVNLTYTVTAQTTTPIGQYTISITATSTAGAVPPASTSTSTSTTVLVGAQNFQLSNTGATIASPGASGSSTITISPTGGYTGQVTMSCAVIDPANSPPTCAIPSPISVTGSPVTTTLTLTTQPTTTPSSYTISVTGTSAGSLNATTTFTVFVPVAPPSFTLSSTAVTIASPGPSGTSTITITPSGGFTGSVALSCAVSSGPTGGADAPTCSVTAPPAISGTTPVTATLTISTTPASSAALHDPMRRTFQVGGGVALAALLFFSVPGRRRRLKTLLGLLLSAAVADAGIGCGSAVNNTPTTPANPGAPTNTTPGTTPGSYTVTVTGTSGATTVTTPVSITVN